MRVPTPIEMRSATAIIDFGLADRTNAVHDIAHAIERNIVEWLALVNDPAHPDAVPIHLDHLDALLDGYESVRPLSGEEAAALAPMTALCHAEFALSEADYFLGVLHSEEKAAMAYDGWLVGHARWFRSAPAASCSTLCAAAPPRTRHKERLGHDLERDRGLPHRSRPGTRRSHHCGSWHLAHHAAPAHLLARHSGLRSFSTWWSSTAPGSSPMRCCKSSSSSSRSTAGGTGGAACAQEGEVRVVPLPLPSLFIALALGVVGSFVLGTLAMRLHAALPHLDAMLTSYSLVASWWQARKHIANWWLWIVVDAIYIGEYIYKDLWLTALLYAAFVALAVLGLRDWRRAAANA